MFHCNTRQSYDWNGFKSDFAVLRIDQVFLIECLAVLAFAHEKDNSRKADLWRNDVIMTSP